MRHVMEKYKGEWRVITTLIIVAGCLTCSAAACGSVGANNPSSNTVTLGNDSNTCFLVKPSSSPCCGTLNTWKFYASRAGTLQATLWRPAAATDHYELISVDEYSITASNLTLSTILVSHEVKANDVIGWCADAQEMIPYNDTAGSQTFKQTVGSLAVGSSVPFGPAFITNEYAFGAIIIANNVPQVTPDTVTISDQDTITNIHTIGVTDADYTAPAKPADSPDFNVTMTGDSSFTVQRDANGWYIETGASVPIGTHTLVVTATDRCGDTDTENIVVVVTNTPPVYDSATAETVRPTAISDKINSPMFLYTFSVTDTDTVTCSSSDVMFKITPKGSNTFDIDLDILADSDLDHGTATSVTTTISCDDGNNTPITRTYTINISDEPVLLTAGLGGATEAVAVGDLSPVGTTVHSFTLYDQDDVISCTVSGGPFEAVALGTSAGTQQFEIRTTALVDFDMSNTYVIIPACPDSPNLDFTSSVTVNLKDDAPTLTGLPGSKLSQPDGIQSATCLHTYSVTDDNDKNDITCKITGAAEANLFDLNAGTYPEWEICIPAGVSFDANDSPYVLDISCVDDVSTNFANGTYTYGLLDKAPTFVGTFPDGSSSTATLDSVVTAQYVASFTVSEAVTCQVSDPSPSVYETRTVAAPVNPNEPEFEIWIGSSVTEASINFDDPAVVLTVACNDATTTINGTYTVKIADDDPVITGLPGTAYDSIMDNSAGGNCFETFSVTDSDDTITCVIDPADTVSTAVFHITAGTYPVHNICLKPNPVLNYDVKNSYTFDVQCQDVTSAVAATFTGSKTVLISNAPPTFVDFDATSTILDDVIADYLVDSFSISDTSTAVISCSATAPAPYNDDFDIRGTPPNFELYLLASNNLHRDNDPTVVATVTCGDGSTDITADHTITVEDADPVWTNLDSSTPAYQTLDDGEPAETILHTFTVIDSDDTILCDVDPLSANFNVANGSFAGEFLIKYPGRPPAMLAYSQSPITIDITCKDGAGYSHTEPYTIELGNGPPMFEKLPYKVLYGEDEVTRNVVLLMTVTDSTEEVDCVLADTVAAAGVEPLQKTSVTTDATGTHTVFEVSVYHTTGFDYESSSGTILVDMMCADAVNLINGTLAIELQNAAPVIINQGGSITISEDEAGIVDMKTISLEKFDAADATCALTDADGGPFAMTDNKLQKTAGNLDFENKPLYTLTSECDDGNLKTTDTFQVIVSNVGPDITNDPISKTIDEHTVSETSLFEFALSEDADDCYQVGTTQPEIGQKYEDATSKWILYYVGEAVAGKPMDDEINPYYEVTMQCEDASGTKGRNKTFSINVNPDEPPAFTNIGQDETTTKIKIKAKEVAATNEVFTLEASNDNGEPVEFSLLGCTPSDTCCFNVTPNGVITSKCDLHSHPEQFYKLELKVKDKYNQNPKSEFLLIEITDSNTPPTFVDVPFDDIPFTENNAVGAVVHDFSHFDPDENNPDVLKYSCASTDNFFDNFSCDQDSGEIKALTVIDYETVGLRTFSVDVTVTDGYNTTTETVVISIENENEPPEWLKAKYTLTKSDEGGAGQQLDECITPDQIKDVDFGDKHRLSLTCADGEGVFVIDQVTGCVHMLREWDLDVTSKRVETDTVSCTLTVYDEDGLFAEVPVDIVITESDDNKPVLKQTSYTGCATVGTQSGNVLNTNADDNDVADQNKRLTYKMIGGGPLSADEFGNINYGDVSSYPKGTVLKSTLEVSDAAGHTDQAPVTVFICDPPPTTISSSSSNSASSSSSSSSASYLAWLIPVLAVAALMLGLLGCLLWRCCSTGRCGGCARCCRQRPSAFQRRIAVTPPKREPSPPRSTPPAPRNAPLYNCEMPISYHYARDIGNVCNAYPITRM